MRNKYILIIVIVALLVGALLIMKQLGAANGREVTKEITSGGLVLGSEYNVYKNSRYGFSVEFPKELNVKEFDEDEDGETILFQKENEKEGFQIFISPYEGDFPLTKDQILKDVPSVSLEDMQEVIIGDGTRALIFWTEDERVGKTREVWFSHNGDLYEITTYADLDLWLAKILSSWRFSEK
jgi:hypothetical protein